MGKLKKKKNKSIKGEETGADKRSKNKDYQGPYGPYE
jgi:hypothetical protein